MVDLTFSMEAIEYFLLVFARISAFVFIAPFFGMKNTPSQAKIAISFFTAILVFSTLNDTSLPSYQTAWGFGILVMKEVVVGLIIGFGAEMCTMIVTFAGRIVDTETGMAMANIMDPTTLQNTTMSGMIYQYTVMLILITSGMYQYLLKALVETFTLIPVSGAVFRTDALLSALLKFMCDFVVIGFRIAMPVFIVLLITNVILGIMAKVAPQMNMFAVGMQLKIITGLSVLFLTMKMLPYVADFIFEEIKTITVSFVEGLM